MSKEKKETQGQETARLISELVESSIKLALLISAINHHTKK